MKNILDISSFPKTLNLNMGNTNLLHPAFCFRYTHKDFGLRNLDRKSSEEFLKKIDILSRLSWQEIMQIGRYTLGLEKISKTQIKQQLPQNIMPDMEITVFHVKDLFRIIGCRDGKVYYILFIDTKGEIYKH